MSSTTLRALELAQARIHHLTRLKTIDQELEAIQKACDHDWTEPVFHGRFHHKVCRNCCLRLRTPGSVWERWDDEELERELAPWPEDSKPAAARAYMTTVAAELGIPLGEVEKANGADGILELVKHEIERLKGGS
jgi:hypothetical protein